MSISGVIQMDGYLEPFRADLKKRFSLAQQWIKKIDDTEGGLEKFSRVCLKLYLCHKNASDSYLGIREVWATCVAEWRHCVSRMGAECFESLPDRRIQ